MANLPFYRGNVQADRPAKTVCYEQKRPCRSGMIDEVFRGPAKKLELL
jgi:hypothetical protein